MEKRPKRILLALDGSEQSLEAARYASRILPSEKVELVLFHVLNKIPDSYWDMHKYPAYRQMLISAHAWESEQKQEIEAFMERARQQVIDAGVPQDSVTVTIQDRKVGIARDIAFESQRNYDAVIVGRTGTSQIKDLVLGSIANKLIGRLTQVPIWVIGGRPDPGKILVAIDRSEGAIQALDYVADMVGGADREVTLIHVIRGFQIFHKGYEKSTIPGHGEGWIERANKDLEETTREVEDLFRESEAKLVDAGFHPDKINSRVISDVASRAGTVVEEARQGGYGTIVVGRRGLSRVEEFFIGRVGNKILQLAREMAVWVVS